MEDVVYRYFDQNLYNDPDFRWNQFDPACDGRDRLYTFFSGILPNIVPNIDVNLARERIQDAFFIGVLLDQGQPYIRAWKGALHLCLNNFANPNNGFWEQISNTNEDALANICKAGFGWQRDGGGFDGSNGSYAIRVQANKFPKWLQSAAMRINRTYNGNTQNIWDLKPNPKNGKYDRNTFENLFTRFKEFDGIGDALAIMAQLILVRNCGMLGGIASHEFLKVKPDSHVRRVMCRLGLAVDEEEESVEVALDALDLKRPADFDAVLWYSGRIFCTSDPEKLQCHDCPLKNNCQYFRINSNS